MSPAEREYRIDRVMAIGCYGPAFLKRLRKMSDEQLFTIHMRFERQDRELQSYLSAYTPPERKTDPAYNQPTLF